MIFCSLFLSFISWVLSFDMFKLCFSIIACLVGWWCMSEFVRYLLSPLSGGAKDDN